MLNEITSASIHAIFLAFGLILPLGVQNIFIFNQGATQHRLSLALPSICTAAFCDTILIILAVCGMSLLVISITWLKLSILIIGCVFLLYMGYLTWTQPTFNRMNTSGIALSAKKQIAFALTVSILNPHAIIDTMIVIGSNAISYEGKAKFVFTITCILVSWGWFIGLASMGHSIRKIDREGQWTQRINKFAALVIWTIALYIGWQAYNAFA